MNLSTPPSSNPSPLAARPWGWVLAGGLGLMLLSALPLTASESGEAASETQASKGESGRKTVGIVLYPGFEVLDVYGPVEMWAYVPDFELVMVAQEAGPVKSAQGTSTLADYSFEDAPHMDILMVPGGFGTFQELQNEALMAFLRKRHEQAEITTSVCSGSALLAKAGILDGRKATSNKAFFSLATSQSDKVEWVFEARWVEDGNVITSSGVSAGIDMALHLIRRLYGEEMAHQIAQGTEYVWNSDPGNDPFAERFAQQAPARSSD